MPEPPITTLAVHTSAGTNFPVTRIVIHCTAPDLDPSTFPRSSSAGMARGTASYFHQQSSGGSAHYVADVVNEEHCVPEDTIAWHAPPNQGSIGLEICGEVWYSRDQWLSPDVWPAVARVATRCRDVADRCGVPLVRLTVADLQAGGHGICGHVDVSLAFQQSDHTDPGPNFPWDHFMAAVLNGPQEVAPMYSPPLVLQPIVADLACPDGGAWLLAADGSVYAFGGAPYHGGANGRGYFAGRKAARLELPIAGKDPADSTYVIVATSGERYGF